MPPLAEVIAAADLPGRVGCAVADAATGEMLEVFNALYPLPPASVAKAVTTAYGLDRLGPGYRFRTTLVTDGTMGRSPRRRSLACRRRGPGARYRRARCHGPRSGRKRHPGGHGRVPDRTDALARHRPDRPRAVAACGLQPLRLGAEPQLQPRVLRMGAHGRGLHRAHGCEVRQPFADGDGLAHDDRAAGLPGLHVRADRGAGRVDRGAKRIGQRGWALAAGAPPARLSGEVFQMLARSRGLALSAPVVSESAPPGRAFWWSMSARRSKTSCAA
jgi:D-alanyl-D-alanine carboxypeptidase/D-alanyl-D-alanine-endopeptidase (penicillin-binding protein 4)